MRVSEEQNALQLAGRVKQVTLDGTLAWKLCCPGCGTWGYLDDDQYHGRVSTQCEVDGCTYHETVDWAARASRPEWET